MIESTTQSATLGVQLDTNNEATIKSASDIETSTILTYGKIPSLLRSKKNRIGETYERIHYTEAVKILQQPEGLIGRYYWEGSQLRLALYNYEKNHYEPNGYSIVTAIVNRILGTYGSNNYANDVAKAYLESLRLQDLEFKEDKITIFLENGHFDSLTKRWIEPSPNDHTFRREKIGYYPNKSNQQYLDMLNEHCTEPAKFLAFLGTIYFPKVSIRKAIWGLGKIGAELKGTFSGTPSILHPESELFQGNNICKLTTEQSGFTEGHAAKAILNISNEMPGNSIIDAEKYKDVVDCTPNKTTRAAYEKAKNTSHSIRHIMNTNSPLRFNKIDEAAYRRTCAIEWINPVKEEKGENFLVLFETKEQREGILALLINHALKYFKGEINFENETPRQKELIAMSKNETIGCSEFIKNNIEPCTGTGIAPDSLYNYYISTTKYPVGSRIFHREMEIAGYEYNKTRISSDQLGGESKTKSLWIDCIITTTNKVSTFRLNAQTVTTAETESKKPQQELSIWSNQ